MYVTADIGHLCVCFGGTQRRVYFHWLSLSWHVWKTLSTCNTVTPLKGQVELFFFFFSWESTYKVESSRPLCSVSNKFFKPSIYLAEVRLHESLLAQPFIDFREANGFERGNFWYHLIYSKNYTADPTVVQVYRQKFNFFFMLKIVHIFPLFLSLLVSL